MAYILHVSHWPLYEILVQLCCGCPVRRLRTRTTRSCSWTVWRRWLRRVYRAVMTWTCLTPATPEHWVLSRPISTCPRPCPVWALAVFTHPLTVGVWATPPGLPWWPGPTTTWALCTVVTARRRTPPNTAVAASNVMWAAAAAVVLTSQAHWSDVCTWNSELWTTEWHRQNS